MFNPMVINNRAIDVLMSDNDKQEYRRLVELIPDNTLLIELGCFVGGSLATIADIIKRKNLQVWAVDIFDNANYNEPNVIKYKEGMLETFCLNMKAVELDPLIICCTSQTLDKWLTILDINPAMIFIDADHSYDQVNNDIQLLKCHLPEKNAIIAGHDYDKNHPGVMKAVQEHFPNNFYVPQNSQIWSVSIS